MFLRGEKSLGHLVWWTGPAPTSPGELAEKTIATSCGIPVLERTNVFWIAPEFDSQLELLREQLDALRGWELHTTALRSTTDSLQALRASATRAMDSGLAAIRQELEALLSQPRQRASLLVRQSDAIERLRKQGEVNRRHLQLPHDGLEPCLDEWARRIDAALCARIVA